MAPIKAETWIAWIGVMVVATATLVFSAYGNFETREHNTEMHDADREDLHRIENKIDQLSNRPPTWPGADRPRR